MAPQVVPGSSLMQPTDQVAVAEAELAAVVVVMVVTEVMVVLMAVVAVVAVARLLVDKVLQVLKVPAAMGLLSLSILPRKRVHQPSLLIRRVVLLLLPPCKALSRALEEKTLQRAVLLGGRVQPYKTAGWWQQQLSRGRLEQGYLAKLLVA